MKRTHRKAIGALLVGVYFLAVTVGGAFHTHLGQSCHDDGAPTGECHSHVCHAGHTHDHEANGSESGTPALDSSVAPVDSHCPICSFMSQKPIPVAVQASDKSDDLRRPTVRLRAIPPRDDMPATIFSRGPPVA